MADRINSPSPPTRYIAPGRALRASGVGTDTAAVPPLCCEKAGLTGPVLRRRQGAGCLVGTRLAEAHLNPIVAPWPEKTGRADRGLSALTGFPVLPPSRTFGGSWHLSPPLGGVFMPPLEPRDHRISLAD